MPLMGVLLAGLFSIVAFVIAPAFGFLMGASISVIGAELVYEDIQAVNRARRFKAVDPLIWSLFTFFAWIAALPWYLFLQRRAALALTQALPSR
jgi:hypothetical protein